MTTQDYLLLAANSELGVLSERQRHRLHEAVHAVLELPITALNWNGEPDFAEPEPVRHLRRVLEDLAPGGDQLALYLAALKEFPPDPREAERRRAQEDLYAEGLTALARGERATRDWAEKRLGLKLSRENVPQTAERLAALTEVIQKTYEPSTAHCAREFGADGMWIEHPRPKVRRTSTYWRENRRDPVARLLDDVGRRIRSRRTDVWRRDHGRYRKPHHRFDDALVATVELVEAAEGDDDTHLTTVLEAREAQAGVRLSPRERQVFLAYGEGRCLAHIAADLGIAASTARVLARRARLKLQRVAKPSM